MSQSPAQTDQNASKGHSAVEVALAALRRRRKHGDGVQILIAKRHHNAPILPGAWEIPGGKIELGEAPQTAAARELLEETGIDCTNPQCVWLFAGILQPPAPLDRPLPRFHLFSVELPSGSVPRALASATLAWVDLKALHKINWPQTNGEIIDAFLTALKGAQD